MTDIELKKYRYDMRNNFLSEMYEFSENYKNLMYFLRLNNEEQLVDIVKKKIWEYAEVFDEVDYNYFYQTEIGNVIISLFGNALEEEYDKLYYIETIVNSSYIANVLYLLKKRLMCSKWLLEYRKLCSYYKNVSLDDIINNVIDEFNKEISCECKDIKISMIDDFNKELEILINTGNIDKKYSNRLIKKIS